MSFLVRRLSRLPSSHARILKPTANFSNAAHVPPTFTQKPPIWVRFAWPIIIVNALIMGSAVDITWSHWATLVQDLEAVAEKNKQGETPSANQVSPTNVVQDENAQIKKDTHHWERRPTWQRATFCGIYVMGWAISTAYFLKYRQTFVTSLRFFRDPKEISRSVPTTTGTTTSVVPESTKTKLLRLVHVSTASDSKGLTLPLSELEIQDGRNETEMVIRVKDNSDSQPSSSNKSRRRRRAYWYLSLTDSIVNGAQYSAEGSRDRILAAWSGTGVAEKMQRASGGWRSGPVLRS